MTDRRIGFFWPLGARVFLAAGVVVFAVTLLRTSESFSWPYQEWAHTNGLFERDGLDIPGPLVAAFGALLSGRLTPPTRMFALPRFGREPAQMLAQSLIPAALVVTVAYLGAFLPVLVLTARTATAGTFEPAAALTAVLILNTLLVLGWLIGLIVQSALAAPIAFAIAFAVTLVGYGVAGLNAVTTVIANGGTVGQVQATALTIFRLSFYTVLLVVALLTAAAILAGRGFERRPRAGWYALWWVLPLALVAVTVVRPPDAILREAEPPRVCRSADGIQYCLHQAHSKDLNAAVDEIAPILALAGKENLPYTKVYDWALSDGQTSPRNQDVFYADVSAKFGVQSVRDVIILQMIAIDVCASRPGRLNGEQGSNAQMLSTRLGGDKEERPDNRFGKLSDGELRQWLTEHRSQVNSCDITDDLLP